MVYTEYQLLYKQKIIVFELKQQAGFVVVLESQNATEKTFLAKAGIGKVDFRGRHDTHS